MAPFSTSTDVDRPAHEVFDYATDPDHFPEWQQGVVAGHLEADGVPAVGARCVTTRRIGFADRQVVSELTRLEPPRAWGVRGVDGPIRARVDLTVDALGADRSRLTIAVDFEGRGIGRVLVPLSVRRAARKEMPRNLARLKKRVEAAGGS